MPTQTIEGSHCCFAALTGPSAGPLVTVEGKPSALSRPPDRISPPRETASRDSRLAQEVERAMSAGSHPVRGIAARCVQGVVYLSGTVDSWHMKQLAQEKARKVPGITMVKNEIDVVRDAEFQN